jgi:hypothetical protein
MVLAAPDDLEFFPANILETLKVALTQVDPETVPGRNDGIRIHKRPLRKTDQTQTLGIYPTYWQPIAGSMEMGRPFPGEHTLVRYPIMIESLVKDTDELRGIATNAYFSSLVRCKLLRSDILRIAMPQLEATVDGVRERVLNWGVDTQHFANGKNDGQFMFMTTIEFWAQTQIY